MIVELRLKLQSDDFKIGFNFEEYVIDRITEEQSRVKVLESDHKVLAYPKNITEIEKVVTGLKQHSKCADHHAVELHNAKIAALEWVLGNREEL